MTLNISFPQATEQKLRARAAATGQDVIAYVLALVEKDLAGSPPAAPATTLAEVLAPIQEGFAQSGMSDDEITQLFEQAREEVWQERQKGSPAR